MSSPVFFYGKLPSHNDFLRYNAGGSEVRALDRWIQEGLYASTHHFGAGWRDAYDGTTPYCFVFSPEDADAFLVGVLRPSRDKSEREYPFCVALKKDRRIFDAKAVPLIPLIFESFLEESREIIQQGMDGYPLLDLEKQVDDLGILNGESLEAGHRSFREYLIETTQEKFWSGLFGDFHDPRKLLVIHNILKIFRPESGIASRPTRIGLRFPLSRQTSFSSQEVCFWVKMSLQLLGVNSFMPHLFWKGHDTKGKNYLFFFLGRVQARSFVQLIDPNAENDSICKLDEEGKERLTQPELRIPIQYSAILARGGLTLAEVLREIAPPQGGEEEDFD